MMSQAEALKQFNLWLENPELDPKMRKELLAMKDDPVQIESHFGRELEFGTGGMRGIIGPGLNRINCHTIRRATQGLADYINGRKDSGAAKELQKVVIAYDTRLYSSEFAEAAALVLAANGIRALLFDGIRPTPLLSFATRELGCAAGIVITASHNPPNYNGYKVYGHDGGQAVSPLVDDLIGAIKKVDLFKDVKTISVQEARELLLLEIVDQQVDRNYLERVKGLSLSSPASCLRVVFTPLHGTGLVFIPDLLRETHCVDLVAVDEQMTADPEFRTVKFANPEDPAALDLALEKARQVGAELVLATDPDCDRVGTAIYNDKGHHVILSGNQVGALLIEYICSRHLERGTMPRDPVLIKTIVTGDIGRKVAESYGLQTVDTLTGFKFIGDRIREFETSGGPQFIFGYEESCGYLTGTFVRDKDAVISTMLIAEMCAFYREQGRNLLQVYDQLQQRHGYYREDLFTVALQDITEADRYVSAFDHLPPQLNGLAVAEKRDYALGRGWNIREGTEFQLNLPKSRVLHYTMVDGSWFAVRPSGTEPKVKFYLSVSAATGFEADEKLTNLREAVQSLSKR